MHFNNSSVKAGIKIFVTLLECITSQAELFMHIMPEIANMVISFLTMQLIQGPLPPSTVILPLQVHKRSLSMAATLQWSNLFSWSVVLLQLTFPQSGPHLVGQHEVPLIPNSSIMLISEIQASALVLTLTPNLAGLVVEVPSYLMIPSAFHFG